MEGRRREQWLGRYPRPLEIPSEHGVVPCTAATCVFWVRASAKANRLACEGRRRIAESWNLAKIGKLPEFDTNDCNLTLC